MTKLINVFFAVALSFIGSSAFAQTQLPPGTHCGNGIFVKHPNVCPPAASGVVGGGNVYQQQQPQYQQPQYAPAPVYQQNGAPNGLTKCEAVGALGGGAVGSLNNKHKGQATIIGAIAGGLLGHWVCSDSNGQRVVVQQAPQRHSGNMGNGIVQRTISEPSDCDIEGRPELQNLRIPHDQCRAIRNALTVKEPSDCDVGAAKDMKGLTRAQCDAIRASMTEKRDGHCRIGGVDYPNLIDNPAGCQAKFAEIVAAQQPVAVPTAMVQTASTTPTPLQQVPVRDNIVRACKLQEGPNTPVLAVSVPDPSNPGWKLVPSNPGETCQEWKNRIESSLG